MKILITGGCGFLGSNLTAHFLKLGCHVIIIDALYRKGSLNNLEWLKKLKHNGELSFHNFDISNFESLEKLFKLFVKFDYVCHVAGQVAMTTSIDDPRKDLMTNVLGSFNVLECVRKFSPNALIAYSSTNKVYGDLNWLRLQENFTRYFPIDYPNGLDENLPLDFSTPYGCSKGSADQYFRDWSRVYGIKTVVFRHSSIYGGRQFASFDQGWVGWFCSQAINQSTQIQKREIKQSFTISGTGKQVRDVLHSSDLISLYESAYNYKEKVSGKIFNIGGGINNSLSLLELFDILSEKLDMDNLSYKKLERRKSDQDYFVANINSIKSLINWEPKVSFNDGIDQMIDWTKKIIK